MLYECNPNAKKYLITSQPPHSRTDRVPKHQIQSPSQTRHASVPYKATSIRFTRHMETHLKLVPSRRLLGAYSRGFSSIPVFFAGMTRDLRYQFPVLAVQPCQDHCSLPESTRESPTTRPTASPTFLSDSTPAVRMHSASPRFSQARTPTLAIFILLGCFSSFFYVSYQPTCFLHHLM